MSRNARYDWEAGKPVEFMVEYSEHLHDGQMAAAIVYCRVCRTDLAAEWLCAYAAGSQTMRFRAECPRCACTRVFDHDHWLHWGRVVVYVALAQGPRAC